MTTTTADYTTEQVVIFRFLSLRDIVQERLAESKVYLQVRFVHIFLLSPRVKQVHERRSLQCMEGCRLQSPY